MPCWNAAASIERALSSILAERDISLECIVIDDGSTDGTGDVVGSIADRDPRVVVLRLPSNVGVSAARNAGLAAARGDWLAFMDADDRFLPGAIGVLMRPTADPEVLAVIGQRIWSDGQRTWLSPLYDIPDIREPGRKSIRTHPGLLYYAALAGKAFHRSLVGDLQFDGRVLGDQPWTIRALLRAGDRIEVIGDTIFEWSRPHPDRQVETITVVARASARGATEMATVAITAFRDVADEVDRQIDDETGRNTVKQAYFDRLLRSDLGGPIGKALERRDPAIGEYLGSMVRFLESIPSSILATSGPFATLVLRPPARRWPRLPRSARPAYRSMLRVAFEADPRVARRISWSPVVTPVFELMRRSDSPLSRVVASAWLTAASVAADLYVRIRRR